MRLALLFTHAAIEHVCMYEHTLAEKGIGNCIEKEIDQRLSVLFKSTITLNGIHQSNFSNLYNIKLQATFKQSSLIFNLIFINASV